MSPKKEDDRDRKWIAGLVVAVIGSLGGATGGTYLFISSSDPNTIQQVARPDPFTGTQGQRIESRLDSLTAEVHRLERRVDLLPPRELEQGMALLTREVELLREEIERLQAEH